MGPDQRTQLLNEALQLSLVRDADSDVLVLHEHYPDTSHAELVTVEAEARTASIRAGQIVEEALGAVAGSQCTFEEAENKGRAQILAHISWIDSSSIDRVWGLNQANFFR